MAKQKLPICFISYCHDDADFPALEAFEEEIEKQISGAFRIIRDKSNISVGGLISDHEDEIHQADVVILICTPQYKRKVKERAGGVHREYGQILSRYQIYLDAVKNGNSPRPFALIPILFSGAHDSSIMSEISDNLYLDFTKFRVVKGKSGKFEVPEFVQSQHRDIFHQIRSKLDGIRNGIEENFAKEYDYWLNLLFLEDRHEAARKKYRFNNVEDLLNELFVKTRSYNRIVDGDKCILIGRKGSGKSTIVDHFHRGNDERYKPPIQIIVDNFDLGFLYNHVFTAPHSSDLQNVLRVETYFEAVWRCYIYLQCGLTLIEEEAKGANSKGVSEIIADITNLTDKRQKLRWSEFVGVCEAVQAYVNHTIQEIPAGTDFFARVSAKLTVDEIVSSVIGVDQLDALSRCISACNRHFVFALDGFDQRFEDFRSSNSIMSSMDGEEKDNRIQFEIGWLKGLLRSVLELRSSDEIVQDKIAFCITIPQDRYLEVRSTERDDYRYRALAANLQWSALELSILIRKRLEGLTTISSDKQLSPLDRLEEVLMAKELSIPRSIEMRVGGNVITLSFFKYLLRHTFWRPRDFIFYVAAILTNMKYSRKHSKVLDADLVKDIISRTTYDVIGTEFIKEFQSSITNIKKNNWCF